MRLSRATALFAVLVFLPLSIASFVSASVSDVVISGEGLIQSGNTVYLIPGRPVQGVLSFTMAQGVEVLHIDYRALDQRITSPSTFSVRPDILPCVGNRCSFNVIFYANPGTSNLFWRYSLPGAASMTQVTVPIQIDSTAPVFVRLGTPTCQQNCALPVDREVSVRAYFTETGSGMDAATVSAVVGGQTFPAALCTQNTCDIPVRVPASAVTNGAVTVTIPAARDRSGNLVTAAMSGSFTVDNIPPRITSITAQSGSSSNAPTGVVTGSFTLAVTVEESSTVTAVADISSLSNLPDAAARTMQCNTATPRRCTLAVAPTQDLGEHDIVVTVSDAAGLTETQTTTVRVLERATGTLNAQFTATGTIKPGTIDLGVAKLFSQRVFISDVELRTSEFGIEIADVRIERCTFRTGGRTVTVPMGTPTTMGRPENPTFMLPFSPMGTALANSGDHLDIECALLITAIRDNRIYATPQRATLRTSVRLIDNPELPVRIEKLQREAKEKADRWSRSAGTLRGTYAGLTAICQVRNIMESSEIAGRVVAGAINMIPLAQGTAQGIHGGANSVEQARNRLSSLPIGGDWFCDRMMCTNSSTGFMRTDVVEAVGTRTVTLGVDKIPVVGSFLNITTGGAGLKGVMNPYKSLPIAVVQMCPPAIISHVETYSQIQCEYSRCLTQDVAIGMPVSACLSDKDFQTCRMVGGALFWTSPGAALQTMRNAVVDVLNNPLTWPVVANSIACAPRFGINEKNFCRLPSLIQSTAKKAQAIQQFTQIQQSLQGMSRTCAGTPVLRDDFYGVIPDANGVVCNQAYCENLEGAVQSGRFIAHPTSGGIQYYQLQPKTNAQGQIIRDAQGQPTYTTKSIESNMVPRSVRDNLEMRAQQLRSFDTHSQEFQNAINNLPEIRPLREQLAAAESFNTPGATQAAQQLTGNKLPTPAPTPAPAPVSPAAGTPATPPAAPLPGTQQPPVTPATPQVTPSAPIQYSVSGMATVDGKTYVNAEFWTYHRGATAVVPLSLGVALSRSQFVALAEFGSGGSGTITKSPTGTAVFTSTDGKTVTFVDTEGTGHQQTKTISRVGNELVEVQQSQPFIRTCNLLGFCSYKTVGTPTTTSRPIMLPTPSGMPTSSTTPEQTSPGQTSAANPPATAPAPASRSPGEILLEGFRIEQELETLRTTLATTLGPTADGDSSSITARRNELQRQITTKEAELSKLGFNQPGVLTPQAFTSNLIALIDAYGAASNFYAGTSTAGLAGAGLTAAANVADYNQKLLIDFGVRLGDAFEAGDATRITELYNEFNALTTSGAPLARMAEDVALFEQTRDTFAKEVAARLDEARQREAETQARIDAQSTLTFRLTYAMQNARAVMGITNALPVGVQKKLGNVINNGFARSEFAQALDFENHYLNAMCLHRNDVSRDGTVAGFTANHRPGLALSAFRSREYSDELVDFIAELESTDWAALDVDAPLLPAIGENKYTYVVTGMMNTDPRDTTERGEFILTLEGNAGTYEIERGFYDYGRPSPLAQSKTLTTEYDYDQVCVELTDDLSSLLTRTTSSGNRHCTNIRG